MAAVIAVPIKKDVCLRVKVPGIEDPIRIFFHIKQVSPRKVQLQMVLPAEVKMQRSPDPGEEAIWPDGGVNCANEREGYRIKASKRGQR